MSYLLQLVRRRDSSTRAHRRPRGRVHAAEPARPLRRRVRPRLRRGHVAARRRKLPTPRLVLQIADCVEHDQPRVLGRHRRSCARTRSTRSTRCIGALAALPRRPRRRGGAASGARAAAPTHRKEVAMSYLKRHGTRRVPQWVAARRARSPNSAGGYAWAVDDWTRLRRFLDPRLRGRLATTRPSGR